MSAADSLLPERTQFRIGPTNFYVAANHSFGAGDRALHVVTSGRPWNLLDPIFAAAQALSNKTELTKNGWLACGLRIR